MIIGRVTKPSPTFAGLKAKSSPAAMPAAGDPVQARISRNIAKAAIQSITSLVDGRLRPDPHSGGPRLWTRNDGSAGASFEVVADRVQFLDRMYPDADEAQEESEAHQEGVETGVEEE